MSITFSLARKISFLFTTALFFLSSASLFGQAGTIDLENWQTFSSLKDIRGAVADSRGRIWAATGGGIFVYTPGTGEFQEFRNTNGLFTLDITAIQADRENKRIYLGAFDGTVDIVDEDFHFSHILDIAQSPYAKRQINDFLIRDSVAYIATDFGIVTFDVNRKVVIETIDRVGSLQPNVEVTKLLLQNDTLWAATGEGIGKVSVNEETLREPKNWQIYGKNEGLLDNKIVDIVFFENTLFTTTGQGIFRFENGNFVKSYDTPGGLNSLSTLNGDLYYADPFFLFKAPNEALPFKNEYFGNITGQSALSSLGSIIVFFKNFGAALIKDSDTTYIIPNTPTTNEFNRLALDNDGNLWNVSDVNPAVEAFSVLKDGEWNIITNRTHPVLGTANTTFHRVSVAPDASVWLSAKGSGLAQVKEISNGYDVTRYDTLNSPIRGTAGDANYVVIGETASDASGTLWAVNRFSPTSMLIARTAQGTFYTFQSSLPVSQRHFLPLAIDASGTKWLGSEGGHGLYWFNENRTLENKADDKEGLITASGGILPDNSHTSLAVDRNGSLWIGSPTGLAIMFNPSAVLNNSTPSIRRINPLAGQFVNAIFIDALDQKWVATRNGVYVLNEDGTEVLKIITTDNSPLVDNNVQTIAINSTTGRVYLGTKKGLSTASSLSIMPLSEYSIKAFPQPFKPEQDDKIFISGLAPDSHVRILTSNGELIQSFDTKSERIAWDGRKTDNELAPSGVYIVVAFSKSGGTSSVGKFTLLRQ